MEVGGEGEITNTKFVFISFAARPNRLTTALGQHSEMKKKEKEE